MRDKASTQKGKNLNQRAELDELLDSWPPELIGEYLTMNQEERRKNFASPGDVAMLLSKSASTVRKWCEEGQVPYIRINGRRQIDVRNLKHHWRAAQSNVG